MTETRLLRSKIVALEHFFRGVKYIMKRDFYLGSKDNMLNIFNIFQQRMSSRQSIKLMTKLKLYRAKLGRAEIFDQLRIKNNIFQVVCLPDAEWDNRT